jgi:hypothetical protein
LFTDSHGCTTMSCAKLSCPANQECQVFSNFVECGTKKCNVDSDCGVCFAGQCAPRMSICVTAGQGGAQGAAGTYGGGGVTGKGGAVMDSGAGGAGGAIDGGGKG